MRRMLSRLIVALVLGCAGTSAGRADELPLVDTHIHYSHDAWELYPPEEAVAILRNAGLRKAFVSSSPDEGTQKLYRLAPDLVVPVLRPYRRRGELKSWINDPTIVDLLTRRLAEHRYAGIGEFHVFGADAGLSAVRGLVELARKHDLFLHAHADAAAVERILAQYPEARVLWAHAGFEELGVIETMMERHSGLSADLSFRFAHIEGDRVTGAWLRLFERFPERFTVGTDTYTPSRWDDVAGHAEGTRRWLASLPEPLRGNIAFRNAERLLVSSRKPE